MNIEYVETITELGMQASILKKKLLENGVPEAEWNAQIMENISVNAAFELFLQGYDFNDFYHEMTESGDANLKNSTSKVALICDQMNELPGARVGNSDCVDCS